MAFDEVQFPVQISYGSRGGPSFNTDVIRLENAHEARTGIWMDAVHNYNARWGVKFHSQLKQVFTFFYARKGKLRGFRYKDWLDFAASQEDLLVTGDDAIQLRVNYASGSQTHNRKIRKPNASPAVTMRRNAGAFTDFTLDTVTGIAQFTVPDITASIASDTIKTINDITQASPAVVETSAVHNFITGDVIEISSVGGMVEVVDGPYTITVLTTTTFELDGIDSTLFTAHTSGGNAQHKGISRSTVAHVRAVAHGFTGTPLIHISGVVGMTEINDLFAAIVVIDVDRFTIAIDTSAFTLYASAGDAGQYPQPGTDVMDWTGEFDVPVRFDTDDIRAGLEAFELGEIPDIPLTEVLED